MSRAAKLGVSRPTILLFVALGLLAAVAALSLVGCSAAPSKPKPGSSHETKATSADDPRSNAAPQKPQDGVRRRPRLRVSCGLPKLVRSVNPSYPESARAEGVRGTVVARLQIDEAGRIEDVEVVSSPDHRLSAATVDALRRWIYEAPLLNGEPVPSQILVGVKFQMNERAGRQQAEVLKKLSIREQ